MKRNAAFVIPYFGRIPDYFDLWAASAGMNPDFDFLIFSDLDFPVQKYANIHLIKMTFKEVQNRIMNKLNMKVIIDQPYKLCDYKPTYGFIFSEYLTEYEFWGFCDVDLIFGDISHFITEQVLQKYNKIMIHGHFCLLHNDEKMNKLFFQKYPNVLDYKFAFNTRYSCHFDESGTIAYADEYDPSIKLFFDWIMADVDFNNYFMKVSGTEACCIWNRGKLTCYWDNGMKSAEIMYIHLQKREMYRNFKGLRSKFAIFRDEFVECDDKVASDILNLPVDAQKELQFDKLKTKRNRKIKIQKIKRGGLKILILRKIRPWRITRKYIVTKEIR